MDPTPSASFVSESDSEEKAANPTPALTPGMTTPSNKGIIPSSPSSVSSNKTPGKGQSIGANVVPQQPVAQKSPKLSLLRFPVRIGITWDKGERLEAQDFSDTWYPSKIVEISEEDMAVLIHFEGWNQRYDEWHYMNSERLRPLTRHSERKDKSVKKNRKTLSHPIFRPGDDVLAKWKDCRKYPATVKRLIEDSTYEVVFYDGVIYHIQAINIQPLPESMKTSVPLKPEPATASKLSFKQFKVTLPSSISKKQKSPQQAASNKILARNKKLAAQAISPSKRAPKVTLKRDRELDVYCVTHNSAAQQTKAEKSTAPVAISCEATVSSLSEEECLRLFGVHGGQGSKPLSHGLTTPSDITTGSAASTAATAATAANTSTATAASHAHTTESVNKSGSPRTKKRAYTDSSLASSHQFKSQGKASKRKKVRARASSELSGAKKRKLSETSLVKRSLTPAIGATERSKSLDLVTPPISTSSSPFYTFMPFVPSKAFVVEEDHNPYKCPFEGCTKDFRKENLLNYHIKYYHSDQEALSPSSSSSSISTPAQTATNQLPSPLPFSRSRERSLSGNAGPVSTTTNTTLGRKGSLSGNTGAASASHFPPWRGKLKTEVLSPSGVGSPQYPPHTTTATTTATTTPSVQYGITGTVIGGHSVPIPPKRRRRKNDSICSTDSELSASSRGKQSKRQRNDSEISVTAESPEVAGRESLTDSSRLRQDLMSEQHAGNGCEVKQEAGGGSTHADAALSGLGLESAEDLDPLTLPDTEEWDEDEMASDVVSCSCRLQHTQGLMIQCELCMCWQHFKCADVKKSGKADTSAVNYVCQICQEPRGVRDSCRFLCDQEWERRGELPTFPLKQQVSGSNPIDGGRLESVGRECNDLLASLHSVKRALHSTRAHIKISREEDDAEFQLWQTDWDTWTKPEETTSTLTPQLSPTISAPEPSAQWTSGEDRKDHPLQQTGSGLETETSLHQDVSADQISPTAVCSLLSPACVTSDSVSASLNIPATFTSTSDTSLSSPRPNSQLFSISATPPKIPAGTVAAQSAGNINSVSACPTTSSTTIVSTSTSGESSMSSLSVGITLAQSAGPVEQTTTSPTSPSSHSPSASVQSSQTIRLPPPPTQSYSTETQKTSPSTDLHPPLLSSAVSSTDSPLSIITRETPTNPNPLPTTSHTSPFHSSISPSINITPTVTPPQMISPSPLAPPTPSSGRSAALMPSIVGAHGTEPLVQHLFMGPAGDAPVSAAPKQPSPSIDVQSDSSKLKCPSIDIQSESTKESDPCLGNRPDLASSTSLSPSSEDSTAQPNMIDKESGLDNRQMLKESEPHLQPRKDGALPSNTDSPAEKEGNFHLSSQQKVLDDETSHLASLNNQEDSSMQKESRKDTAPSVSDIDIVEKNSSSHLPRDLLPSSSSLPGPADESKIQLSIQTENGSETMDESPIDDLALPASGFYLDVEGLARRGANLFNDDDDDDTLDNDTDTAEESWEPSLKCEHNILTHVCRVHDDVEAQLDTLEARLTELENQEQTDPTIQLSEENVLNDVPALKKSLAKLARFLEKVQTCTS